MSQHQTVTDEAQEQAALYALGLLDSAEAAAFQDHLRDCGVCRREADSFSEVTAELAFAVAGAKPPSAVRQGVMRRIAPPPALVRATEGEWTATPFAGVDVRQLFTDPAGNVTSLVRLAPGALYPPHRHAGHEHCYVLEGDLVFDDHTLNAGDYEVATPETNHSPTTTKNGCLLLIINNVADQLLPLQ